MGRPVYATLPLILVTFLLFQGSECSRSLPQEERQLRVLTAPPAAYYCDEPPYHRNTAESRTRPVTVAISGDDSSRVARLDDDGAALSSSPATASPRDKDVDHGGVVGSSGHNRSALLRPPVLQRSKLARRFLVVEGADSAARASCRSSDVHISCTPPSEH